MKLLWHFYAENYIGIYYFSTEGQISFDADLGNVRNVNRFEMPF